MLKFDIVSRANSNPFPKKGVRSRKRRTIVVNNLVAISLSLAWGFLYSRTRDGHRGGKKRGERVCGHREGLIRVEFVGDDAYKASIIPEDA